MYYPQLIHKQIIDLDIWTPLKTGSVEWDVNIYLCIQLLLSATTSTVPVDPKSRLKSRHTKESGLHVTIGECTSLYTSPPTLRGMNHNRSLETTWRGMDIKVVQVDGWPRVWRRCARWRYYLERRRGCYPLHLREDRPVPRWRESHSLFGRLRVVPLGTGSSFVGMGGVRTDLELFPGTPTSWRERITGHLYI